MNGPAQQHTTLWQQVFIQRQNTPGCNLLDQQAVRTSILASLPTAECCLAVQLSPHRVEVAVMCWPITLDREENYWTVLYCLQVTDISISLARKARLSRL